MERVEKPSGPARKALWVGVRTRLPVVARLVALFLIIAGLVFVAFSYYRYRHNKAFVLRNDRAQLSTEVDSVTNGYERTVTDNGKLRLKVKAARDIVFHDGHHELEDVTVESYSVGEDTPDKIAAHRSIYDPDIQLIRFMGDVNIDSRTGLKAHSEEIVYDQKADVAKSDKVITFERENVSGKADSGVLNAKTKHLDLNGDVQITVKPVEKEGARPPKDPATTVPIVINSPRGTYDQTAMQIAFSGGATAQQGTDVMSGDTLTGFMTSQKKIDKIQVRSNAYLRSLEEGHAAEVHSTDMDFFFNPDQKLEKAVATGSVTARSLNSDSQFELSSPDVLTTNFAIQNDRSLVQEMHTNGRSTVKLPAPQSRASDPRAANKQLTADTINLYWHASGKDLERAEAIGNAEAKVDPVQTGPRNQRKTITASRFDCKFFETGNLAEQFTANESAKVVMVPTVPSEKHGTQVLTANKMNTVFVRETQDVERFDAEGDAKFNELDRNGIADRISYEGGPQLVHLRGGEPTVWDSKARTKANEIDTDLSTDISYGKGRTSTTYYSQEQTGGAAPFRKVKSPVYATADKSEFQHDTGVAIYTGNARLWQDDNFVRGDQIKLFRDSKRMEAAGHVQTAIYSAKKSGTKANGTMVPVFTISDSMWYSDPDRQVHYQSNVDMRQGTDRITCDASDVFLQKEKNEVERSTAENNVVITEPGRRGTGSRADYAAADNTMVLKGSPARVEDTEQGTTEGGRLTVYMNENRVVADDTRGPQSSGRVKSVHLVRK